MSTGLTPQAAEALARLQSASALSAPMTALSGIRRTVNELQRTAGTPALPSNLVVHEDFPQDEGFLRKTGVGAYEAVRTNRVASDPTVNDDLAHGYTLFSRWINTSTDEEWVCTDDAEGAAVWKQTTSSTGGGTHNVLSATHVDSLAAAVVRGDMMVGNATPKWARVAIAATAGAIWSSNATDPFWRTDSLIVGNQMLPDGSDANFWFGKSGALFVLNWDANEYLQYDRTSNIWTWNIGFATVVASIDANEVWPRNRIRLTEIAAPGTPPANNVYLYAKDSGGVSRLFYKADSGTEYGPLDAGGGGSHNLLSATHADTTAGAAGAGAMIFGGGGVWQQTVNATGYLTYEDHGRLAIIRDGSYSYIALRSYSSAAVGDSPYIQTVRSRGSLAVPAAVGSADFLFDWDAHGQYDTTVGHTAIGAVMRILATQAWTAANHGTKWEFYSTPDNTATPLLALTIDQDRALVPTLHIRLNEISAPGTPAANTLVLYAKDVSAVSRLHYKDDGGTEHLLGNHGVAQHTGIIGETELPPIRIILKKALPAATNNATLDDDYLYKKPYNVGVRINKWYVRFESVLAANATFEIRKNGTVITGSSITVTAGNRDAAIDDFTETVLATDDSLEVWQTAGNAENIGGTAYIFGDMDVVNQVA